MFLVVKKNFGAKRRIEQQNNRGRWWMIEQREQLKKSKTFLQPATETPHSELTHRKKQGIQPI